MPYKPGQSGNPSGRRKGQLTALGKLRTAIEDAMPTILDNIIQAAVKGDMQACRILVDKAIPTPKTQALPVVVPIGADLSETGGNVINATLNGQIPPDMGAQLIAALAAQAKIIEIDELTKRIEVLENERKGKA